MVPGCWKIGCDLEVDQDGSSWLFTARQQRHVRQIAGQGTASSSNSSLVRNVPAVALQMADLGQGRAGNRNGRDWVRVFRRHQLPPPKYQAGQHLARMACLYCLLSRNHSFDGLSLPPECFDLSAPMHKLERVFSSRDLFAHHQALKSIVLASIPRSFKLFVLRCVSYGRCTAAFGSLPSLLAFNPPMGSPMISAKISQI